MYPGVYPHVGTPTGNFYLLLYWYPYPQTRTRVETHTYIMGKGYLTDTGLGRVVETCGFTHALAYPHYSSLHSHTTPVLIPTLRRSMFPCYSGPHSCATPVHHWTGLNLRLT